ncbi:hypothetical protein AB0M20_23565 [Actinoplanes sp. NPDC051633]|uniref:hypothetical protein n=1 Tax=Actinoplanes sp. NPDC051633 TaxID=3155670 RepID=UPI0034177D73
MSEPTPQHHQPTNPSNPTVPGSRHADLIAGDPPVPLTVWRTAHTPVDTGRSIGTRLATRLVAAYSRPGDIVVDVTADHALTPVCAASRRRHHPAWFTDASSLIIGPATPPQETGFIQQDDGPEELLDLRAWFGDDLTDPDLPPADAAAADPSADGSLRHATSLVVASWPLDAGDAGNRVRLAWLLTAGAALLRPGGCLILVVAVPAGAAAAPEDFTSVMQAAAGAGLGYLQHIVAVAAGTDGDMFVYHVTDEELLALAGTGQRWQMAHLRVHADLMVFSQTRPQPARRQPTRRGGDRRG